MLWALFEKHLENQNQNKIWNFYCCSLDNIQGSYFLQKKI